MDKINAQLSEFVRLKGVSSAAPSSLGRYNTLQYSLLGVGCLYSVLILVENIYASVEPLQPEQDEQAEEVQQAEVTCRTSTANPVLPGILIIYPFLYKTNFWLFY